MTVRVDAWIDLKTDPATAFAAAADLPSQESWVIATRLYPIDAFVMGIGICEITATATGCRFTWAEDLDLPFGVLGRLGWPLVKPIAHLALLACLRRMAKQLERGTLTLAMAPDALPRDALVPPVALAPDGAYGGCHRSRPPGGRRPDPLAGVDSRSRHAA